MRKIMFAVGMLVLLALSAAFAQERGRGNAMSPVGVWDFETENSSGGIQKTMSVFHFGGTATNTPATDPNLSLHGTWQKTGRQTFVVSFYSMVVDESDPPQLIGYVKANVENVQVDKDTIEGRSEIWFLLGTDPFNPLATFFIDASDDFGRRLKAEGPS